LLLASGDFSPQKISSKTANRIALFLIVKLEQDHF